MEINEEQILDELDNIKNLLENYHKSETSKIIKKLRNSMIKYVKLTEILEEE